MQRSQFNIKNSRVWHLCSLELEPNAKVTLDNWTRYSHEFREVYYLNEETKFLEVDHFHHTFTFFKSGLRKSNQADFRAYYKNYLKYQEVTK